LVHCEVISDLPPHMWEKRVENYLVLLHAAGAWITCRPLNFLDRL